MWLFVALSVALIAGKTSVAGRANGAAVNAENSAAQQTAPVTVFGAPVVTLTRPRSEDSKRPQFVEATVLPSVGMNLLELKAYWPGTGEVQVIQSPKISDAKRMLEYGNDEFSNESFKIGGAILLPYPNRIRGAVSSDGKTIETTIAGKEVSLPANWHGKNPGARPVAMHGLILGAKFGDVKEESGPEESSVSAILHADDFGGHWPSKTDVSVRMALKNDSMDIVVTSKNVGNEALPMAIGFHPYFGFPSGDRRQGRLHIPAQLRVMVNNYDDVFPRGQLASVLNTRYDFTASGGAALEDLFMDDCFTGLKRNADGSVPIEITDPKARYGLRIRALSQEIKSVQVYAPPEQSYVVVEPQFNLADPYNRKVWRNVDTGMVSLEPGQSVAWHIRLELFVPGN